MMSKWMPSWSIFINYTDDRCVNPPCNSGKSIVRFGGQHPCNWYDQPSGCETVTYSDLIVSAREIYEEDERRAKLIGEVFVLIQQEMYQEAFDVIYEQEVIDFSTGDPVAVSPALAKARGES